MACILGAGALADSALSPPSASSHLCDTFPEVVEFQPGRPGPRRHALLFLLGPPHFTSSLCHKWTGKDNPIDGCCSKASEVVSYASP